MSRNYVVDQMNIENLVKVRLGFQSLGVSFDENWRAKVHQELKQLTDEFLDAFEKNKGKPSKEMFKDLLPSFRKNLILVENVRNVFGIEAATLFFSITAGIPEEVSRHYFMGDIEEYADLYTNLSKRPDWDAIDLCNANRDILETIESVKGMMQSRPDWLDLAAA